MTIEDPTSVISRQMTTITHVDVEACAAGGFEGAAVASSSSPSNSSSISGISSRSGVSGAWVLFGSEMFIVDTAWVAASTGPSSTSGISSIVPGVLRSAVDLRPAWVSTHSSPSAGVVESEKDSSRSASSSASVYCSDAARRRQGTKVCLA